MPNKHETHGPPHHAVGLRAEDVRSAVGRQHVLAVHPGTLPHPHPRSPSPASPASSKPLARAVVAIVAGITVDMTGGVSVEKVNFFSG